MKKVLVLTIILLMHYIGIAQTAPSWTKKTPVPSNKTFYYCPVTGLGSNYNQALDDAYNKLHRLIDEKLGTTIIGKSSMDNQGSVSYYAVDGQTHTIKTNKACEWPKAYEKSDHWEFLFQVAEAGNISVDFDNFNDCHTMIKDHSEDWRALGLSILPGGGQFYKNHNGLAWTIIGSEVLLIGGGVTCYFIGQNQQDIMSNHKTSYNDYQSAKSTYNTVTTLQPWLYGAAAVVYVVNLATAYFINDNRENKSLTLTPKIIPTNTDLALGVGFSYKF